MQVYFQLIRVRNLFIIALTMMGIYFFYAHFGNNIAFSVIDHYHFALLVFVTILIAAAGNVINDIFDIKADKFNKPDKVIVGEIITEENATILYWFLNASALLIALYLSFFYKSLWLLIIPISCFGALWIYSKRLKKISFIGNLLIAVLAALVPLLTGVFVHEAFGLSGGVLNLDDISLNTIPTLSSTILINGQNGLVFFFALFAFLLNFSREWIKDIQDIEGDKLISSYSLAIQLGEKKMKMYTGFFMLMTIGFLFLILFSNPADWKLLLKFQMPLFLVIISLLLSFNYLFKKRKVLINKADLFLKISFLLGITLPFWWSIFA